MNCLKSQSNIRIKLELWEIPFLNNKKGIITFFDQLHFQFTIPEEISIDSINFLHKNLFSIRNTDPGQQKREPQSTRRTEIPTVVGKSTRPKLRDFSIQVMQGLLVLISIHQSLQLFGKSLIVFICDTIDEGFPHCFNHRHSTDRFQLTVLLFLASLHFGFINNE